MLPTDDQERAKYLADGLRELGMNQISFARMIEFSPETISRWINVKTPIPEITLQLIKKLLFVKHSIELLHSELEY